MNTDSIVDAGTKLLIRAVLLAFGVYLLYLIQDIVLLAFLSVLFAAVLSPAVGRLTRIGLPRTLAVPLLYVIIIGILSGVLTIFVPAFVSEVKLFSSDWPTYVAKLSQDFSAVGKLAQPFGATGADTPIAGHVPLGVNAFSGIFGATVGIFTGIVSVVVFFFLSFYLLLDENGIEKFFLSLTPAEYRSYSVSLAKRIQGKVGGWLVGQLIIMLIIFAIYFIGLTVFGVPYALALALFGGLVEIIPYLGPIVAAIPAVIIAFIQTPALALVVLLFYIVSHQVESHVIAPQVMKRSVGLNPVALILSVLIGAKLAGPFGALISVPVAIVLGVVVDDILADRSAKEAVKNVSYLERS